MNLIINAAEAIGDKPGQITVTTGETCFAPDVDSATFWGGKLPQPGPNAFLTVRDTGCGMEAATISRIFDPFFSTKQNGSGLGLSYSLGIIRSHTGALHFKSTPGIGTSLTIYFPLCEGTAPVASSNQTNGRLHPGGDYFSCR